MKMSNPNSANKIIIQNKVSDNIYIISEDDTNEILYSEINKLLDNEDYSDYTSDFESLLV